MFEVSVRYIVRDIDSAIDFYSHSLGFNVVIHPAPSFAILSRGSLRLLLSGSEGPGGGSQPMPDGRKPEPGGWNRLQLGVANLADEVEKLKKSGARFRSGIITGIGGKQVIVDDPSGNPIELFEAIRK